MNSYIFVLKAEIALILLQACIIYHNLFIIVRMNITNHATQHSHTSFWHIEFACLRSSLDKKRCLQFAACFWGGGWINL